MLFTSEQLSARHTITKFDSGNVELDAWLHKHALGASAKGLGRTFIWHDGDNRVVAYYTIAAHLLVRESLPRSVGHGSPYQIPAVLLARLALDMNLQGQGLGGVLLSEALQRIVTAAETVGARFVVVDAIDEKAVLFYEHYGFRRVPGTDRLVQKVSTISAALGEKES